MKKALVAGGTGLVGSELLRALDADRDFQTTALVRKTGALSPQLTRTQERVFDFENQQDYGALAAEPFDFVFCCLGTTRRKAGSASQFRRVDFDYPNALLNAVKSTQPVFCLVSSVGAESPTGLYLKTKYDLEQNVFASGLDYVVVRPSLLLGERKEFRFGELLAIKVFGRFEDALRNNFGERIAKYAPVQARDVARALLAAAKRCAERKGRLILEGRGIAGIIQ